MNEAAPRTLVDGRPCEHVPVTDRGLRYGDSLFETIRVMEDRLPLWRWHLQRLETGCGRIGFAAPDHQLLLEEVLRVAVGQGDCVVRVTLTRGDGGKGYAPAEGVRRVVHRVGARSGSCDAVAAIVCQTRLAIGGPLAGLKHGSRLEQVLAAQEVQLAGAGEGVVLDAQERVVEGIHGNVFLIDPDGACVTPDLAQAGVAGVYRAWLMAHAPIRVATVSLEDLREATALFFANAVRGIIPVHRLAGVGEYDLKAVRQFEQATGRPWP